MSKLPRGSLLTLAGAILAAALVSKCAHNEDPNSQKDAPAQAADADNSAQSSQVFVIGDLHFTSENTDLIKYQLLKELGSLSGGRKGFHIIFNGDFLDFPHMKGSCKNCEWQMKEFLSLYSALKGEGFIPHLVFGNHDGSEDKAIASTFPKIRFKDAGTNAFSLKNGARLILLSGAYPTLLNAEFLRKELSAGSSGGFFVFSHFPADYPIIPNGAKPVPPKDCLIESKPEIMRMLASSGATLISSHLHAPFFGTYSSRLLKAPVNVISTPAFTEPLDHFENRAEGARIYGITLLDTGKKKGTPSFFYAEKRFHTPDKIFPAHNGKYLPGNSRKIAPNPLPPKTVRIKRRQG